MTAVEYNAFLANIARNAGNTMSLYMRNGMTIQGTFQGLDPIQNLLFEHGDVKFTGGNERPTNRISQRFECLVVRAMDVVFYVVGNDPRVFYSPLFFNAELDGEVRIAISHSFIRLEQMNHEEHLKYQPRSFMFKVFQFENGIRYRNSDFTIVFRSGFFFSNS